MPTLNWLGKEAVVEHHKQVPFHLLKYNSKLSVGDADSGNLLIEGDNLLALKALLPYYAGQVKCIYIDPPYNTGDENWVYNDNVNAPQIREWLGKVVGREGEDLNRHDKWLCMMYPRMELLVQFLRSDGFLFVSLNEIELARFRLMMDEMLSPKQYVATLIWKSRRNLDNRSLHNVSVDHEYVVVYYGGTGVFRGTEKDMSKYSNPDNDPRGPWMSDNLVGLATKERRPNLHYDLVNPETGDIYHPPQKGWRYSRETVAQKIREGRIIWPSNKKGRPRHKKFLTDLLSEYAGFSSFVDCGNTNEGTEEVSRIMGTERFIFPKPRSLVQILVEQTTSGDDIILDSFAGTGTTGHAVLAQNKADGGDRRFILVEMESNIAQNITAERLRRVIQGYTWKDQQSKSHREEGLGGGFSYCELGATLFDADGQIRREVKFDELARHVFFVETGEPLPSKTPEAERRGKRANGRTPFLGVARGVGVYLLYNGVLRDKSRDGGNVLTSEILSALPKHEGPKVIYGTGCRIGAARLKRAGITFRQIPYEVRVA
jgi:site-specific DNA-methyltransferase (adenine-specific)/adenine-specific DNA-methyltransferase